MSPRSLSLLVAVAVACEPSPPLGMVRVEGGALSWPGQPSTVELEPFFIDERLVAAPGGSTELSAPAASVTWEQAEASCASRGARLPTDAEWQQAGSVQERTGVLFQWTRTLYHPPPDATFAPEMRGTRRVVRGSCCPWLPAWSEPDHRAAFPQDRHSTWLGLRCVRPLRDGRDPNADADLVARLSPDAIDDAEAVRQLLSNLHGPGRMPTAPAVQALIDGLEPGSVVADVGCGLGALSLAMARQVGERGRVYAVDVDEQVLDFVRGVAKVQGIDNLEPRLSRPDDLGLPAASADLLLLYDMVSSLREEEWEGFTGSCLRSLAPGGRLALYQTLGSPPPEGLLERFVAQGAILERTERQAPPHGSGGDEEGVVLWILRAPGQRADLPPHGAPTL